MKESDYVLVSDLTRLRAVREILNGVAPNPTIDGMEEDMRDIALRLYRIISTHERLVKVRS